MEHKTITLDWVEYNLVPVDAQSEDHIPDTGKMVDKYDNLRKLIGRKRDDLCIFWDKMLQSVLSFSEISIEYDNIFRKYYIDPVNFEETTLDKLEYGDVFILEKHIYTENCSDIDIYIWKDINSCYRGQYLKYECWIERMKDSSYINWNTKVIKALRN